MINIGERAGSGLSNITLAWKEQHFKRTEITEKFEPERIVLSLDIQSEKKVTDKVTEKSELVLNEIMKNPNITSTQIAENLEISRKTVAQKLKILKETGKINRIGSDRKGYWVIVE